MPQSEAQKQETQRVKERVRELVAQGVERAQIIDRLGISKGNASRLIREVRKERDNG